MKNLNEACKQGVESGAKYLIVNRRYFEEITVELAKKQKVQPWLVIVEKYKGLTVAVTDLKDFSYDVV